MKFEERFRRGTEGMKFLSTGVCPGCETCAGDFGYKDETDEDGEDIPGSGLVRFDDDVKRGECFDEGSFSRSGCDLCGSPLGRDLYVYHWVDDSGAVRHDFGACANCVCYIANGEIPEDEDEE